MFSFDSRTRSVMAELSSLSQFEARSRLFLSVFDHDIRGVLTSGLKGNDAELPCSVLVVWSIPMNNY